MNYILTCLLGLVAGVGATLVSRTASFGFFVDMIAGIAGAFLVTVLLAQIGWSAPFGVAGAGAVALLGAVGGLALIRFLHGFIVVPDAPRPGARRR